MLKALDVLFEGLVIQKDVEIQAAAVADDWLQNVVHGPHKRIWLGSSIRRPIVDADSYRAVLLLHGDYRMPPRTSADSDYAQAE